MIIHSALFLLGVSVQKIENWLNSRIGLNFRSGLGRMEQAIDILGHPERSYPKIHVTGTNGKGSTIAFLRNLFERHGKKVGSFTSPHMETVHDRICLNGIPISQADFTRIGERVREMEKSLLEEHGFLSYFEILTLMAFIYFSEQEVDVALIEVGIGGLLDTTNVIKGTISVITSLGLDHQETLGDTIEEIAEQKAGIFKPGRTAVVGPLPNAALLICRERAKSLGIDLHEYGKEFSFNNKTFQSGRIHLSDIELGLAGTFQEENAGIALEVFFLFMEQQSWLVDLYLVREALAQTRWAGRLERICDGVYLDGAHNLPAVERLVEFVKLQEDRKIVILFGALKRKDYSAMLSYLQRELPQADLFLTSFSYGESVSEKEAGEIAYISDYQAFIDEYLLKKDEQQLLFITGSLYFVAEVRQFLKSR